MREYPKKFARYSRLRLDKRLPFMLNCPRKIFFMQKEIRDLPKTVLRFPRLYLDHDDSEESV